MKEKKTTDILIVGVGGQGIVLASEIIASVCLAAGYDIKQSEVHGMAQRGGSVVSHVRFGAKVHSPIIEKGYADFLLLFEMLESLRWIDYLHPDGVAFINKHRIDPITVTSGETKYPNNIQDIIQKQCNHMILIDGLDIAQKSGSIRAVNMVFLGALSKYLKFDIHLWDESIRNRVPAKTLEINLAAFQAGRNIVKQVSHKSTTDTPRGGGK